MEIYEERTDTFEDDFLCSQGSFVLEPFFQGAASETYETSEAPRELSGKKKPKVFFDYDAFVETEMKKVEPNLTEEEKRKFATRLRNRKSAQRSRNRQRDLYSQECEKNKEMKRRIEQLELQNRRLRERTVARAEVSLPLLIEVQTENAELREEIAFRAENEKRLRAEINALEEAALAESRKPSEATVMMRESRSFDSLSPRAFLFFSGLLLLSVMFLGRGEGPSGSSAFIAKPAEIPRGLGLFEGIGSIASGRSNLLKRGFESLKPSVPTEKSWQV